MMDQSNIQTVAGICGSEMTFTVNTDKRSLFVDRASRCWVVRDPGGEFWMVPSGEDPWSHRQPINLTEEMQLEPVPRHYLSILSIPR